MREQTGDPRRSPTRPDQPFSPVGLGGAASADAEAAPPQPDRGKKLIRVGGMSRVPDCTCPRWKSHVRLGRRRFSFPKPRTCTPQPTPHLPSPPSPRHLCTTPPLTSPSPHLSPRPCSWLVHPVFRPRVPSVSHHLSHRHFSLDLSTLNTIYIFKVFVD